MRRTFSWTASTSCRSTQITFYAAADLLNSDPACQSPCNRLKSIAWDFWWALKAGASDQYNKATGAFGFTVLGMAAGLYTPANMVTTVIAFVPFNQAYLALRRDCPI